MGGSVHEILPRPAAGRIDLDFRSRRAHAAGGAGDDVAALWRVSRVAEGQGVSRSRAGVRGKGGHAAATGVSARIAQARRVREDRGAAQKQLLRGVWRRQERKHPVKHLREELWFETPHRRDYINITDRIEALVKKSGVKNGLVLVNAMHITASVYINDNESGLIEDYDEWLEQLAPHAPI